MRVLALILLLCGGSALADDNVIERTGKRTGAAIDRGGKATAKAAERPRAATQRFFERSGKKIDHATGGR
jgi:hypothetical protein